MDNRELDRAIAEKFLGWHIEIIDDLGPWWCDSSNHPTNFPDNMFHPSFDPLACSFVLDEIERRNWNWEMEWYPVAGYRFSIWPDKIHRRTAISDNRYKAVCLAALEVAEEAK